MYKYIVHTPDSVDGCETLGSQGHVHFAKLPGMCVCVYVCVRVCVRETLGSQGHVHFAKLPGMCVWLGFGGWMCVCVRTCMLHIHIIIYIRMYIHVYTCI